MRLVGITALSAASLAAMPASASFLVTAEQAGVQSTTTKLNYGGTETFDSLAVTGPSQTTATTNFSSNFGGSGSGITGTYTNAGVTAADVFGGAGGTGNYVLSKDGSSGTSSYTINLSTSNAQGVNYFGMWLSAIDSGNNISFYKSGSLVYSFNASAMLNFINSQSNGSAYYGNPNGGGNGGEAYAYMNFYDQVGSFDQIVMTESQPGAGFESDNHTVGNYQTMSGSTVAGSVPEPATWAMMILGFGLVGAAARRIRLAGYTTAI